MTFRTDCPLGCSVLRWSRHADSSTIKRLMGLIDWLQSTSMNRWTSATQSKMPASGVSVRPFSPLVTMLPTSLRPGTPQTIEKSPNISTWYGRWMGRSPTPRQVCVVPLTRRRLKPREYGFDCLPLIRLFRISGRTRVDSGDGAKKERPRRSFGPARPESSTWGSKPALLDEYPLGGITCPYRPCHPCRRPGRHVHAHLPSAIRQS